MKWIAENWMPVKGFEDYIVSDLGNVLGIYGILKPSTDDRGYKRVVLSTKDGKEHTRLVHRLVALAFIPNPKNLPEVNHTGATSDNRAIKLEWRSRLGNEQHAVKSGRFGKYAGVYFEKRRLHWVARLWSGGRHKHGGHWTYLGHFATRALALAARHKAVKNLKEVL